MSQLVFLVGVGVVLFTQVESQISQTRSVRLVQLDRTNRSHNPKVGGSNPPPATKIAVRAPLFGVGPSALQAEIDVHADVSAAPSGAANGEGLIPAHAYYRRAQIKLPAAVGFGSTSQDWMDAKS